MLCAMKTIRTSGKISLTECKRILNTKGYHYTDNEILTIRDWLYFIGEMVVSAMPDKLKGKVNNKQE